MTRRSILSVLSMLALQACGSDGTSAPAPQLGGSQTAGAGAVANPPSKNQGGSPAPKGGDASKPPVAPEQALSLKQRVTTPAVSDADRKALADGNRAFAFDLYAALAKPDASNLFFSPHSVSSALAMTYAGAKNKTADQMRATLHFTLPDERLHAAFNALDQALTAKPTTGSDAPAPFTLEVANALWAARGKSFLAPYLDTLATDYGAGVQLLDFATDTESARKTINGWVEDKTRDRIKDLLHMGDLTRDTAFVLTNAIYFKGKWSSDFNQSATQDAPFHAPGGDQTAKMMHRVLAASYARGDGYQAVMLPYAASSSEMLVILPDAGKLTQLEAKLDDSLLTAIDKAAAGYMVTLSLPRFSFESRFEVADVLSKLGMPDAFAASAADFSGMDGARDISLSKVVHQAFVAVDEKGTEAAAATAVIGVTTSAPAQMPAVELSVDRPFLVVIRERVGGAILFLARVQSVAP